MFLKPLIFLTGNNFFLCYLLFVMRLAFDICFLLLLLLLFFPLVASSCPCVCSRSILKIHFAQVAGEWDFTNNGNIALKGYAGKIGTTDKSESF